jgi:hypothetical protein
MGNTIRMMNIPLRLEGGIVGKVLLERQVAVLAKAGFAPVGATSR